MIEDKIEIMEKSANQYKKLPADKKMFILGIMQGMLINSDQQREPCNQVERKKCQE